MITTTCDSTHYISPWRAHLAGWGIYLILSIAINTVYRFPLKLIFIETCFFFAIACGLYIAATYFMRRPASLSLKKKLDSISFMLIAGVMTGVIGGWLWSYLMLEYLIDIFLPAEHYLTNLPKDLLIKRYTWGRINDAIFLFAVWAVFWCGYRRIAQLKKSFSIVELKLCVAIVMLLIIVNASGTDLVYAEKIEWASIIISLLNHLVILMLVIAWFAVAFFDFRRPGYQISLFQSCALCFILLLPASLLAVILLDYLDLKLVRYLNPSVSLHSQYSLDSVTLTDVVRRVSGSARQFMHGAFLLGIILIYFFYPLDKSNKTRRIAVFPADWRFWMNNAVCWLFLGLVALLIDSWKFMGASALAKTLLVTKLVVIGSLLSLAARFLILRYEWAQGGTYKLIPRLSLIAVIMGVLLIFLDAYTEVVLHALYLGHEYYALIYSGIDPNMIDQNNYAKAVLFILWFFLWSFVYSFFISAREKMKMTIETLQLQKEYRESQLSLLTNQLDAHFIFNTLTGIRYLVGANPDLARASLVRLSELLRKNLGWHQYPKITLQQELRLVYDYLDLYRIQLEGKLNWNQMIGEGVEQYLIPPMVVQMLVENAIKHGISLSIKPGYINFTAYISHNRLVLQLQNSLSDDTSQKDPGQGIGLQNIQQRLTLIYGDQAKFLIDIDGQCAVVNLIIPAERKHESSSY